MDKTIILITGANSGVGYAATKVITSASEKYHVIMGCRSLEKAEAARAEIEAIGVKGSISTLHLDVTDSKSIIEASELVKAQFGRLDVLINNAAVGNTNNDIAVRFRASLETNVIGPVVVKDTFLPLLFKSQNPYSLYVSSGMGSFGGAVQHPEWSDYPNGDGYRVSKAALDFVAMLDHGKYNEKGLKTFAVCPGPVRSNLRGTDPEAVTAGGAAGDPEVSGELLLDIIQGKRDADVGGFVKTDGTWPW